MKHSLVDPSYSASLHVDCFGDALHNRCLVTLLLLLLLLLLRETRTPKAILKNSCLESKLTPAHCFLFSSVNSTELADLPARRRV